MLPFTAHNSADGEYSSTFVCVFYFSFFIVLIKSNRCACADVCCIVFGCMRNRIDDAAARHL